MGTLLHVRNLKTYFYTLEGSVKAVDGVSYDLNEGEAIGLAGESGCGKSVSALSILRLIQSPPGKIVDGEIWFDGRNLLNMSDAEIRSVRGDQISMIFQEPMTSLNPMLTIGRQITEAITLHLKMDKEAATKRAIELLSLVGISDAHKRINDYPHQYSGGMRQRVMIAMALSCNPKLLIADEPTTALDVTIQAQILEIIRDMTKEFNLALIIISHNLGVLARYTNRVNIMYAGRIIEKGTTKDIYGDPRHPYTKGLISSVPRLDHVREEKLFSIPGLPPSQIGMSSKCAFLPRCAYANDRCRNEPWPDLNPVSDSHSHEVACYVDLPKEREDV